MSVEKRIIFKSAILLFGLGFSSLNYSQTAWDSEVDIHPSYYVMGEYYGSFDDDPKDKIGAEVRAESVGDNTSSFRITFLEGGLKGHAEYPMGGWDEENLSPREPADFNYNTGVLNVTANIWTATLTIPTPVHTATDEQRVITGTRLNRAFTLHRVNRISPTMGWAPPDNAIVLFDGTRESYDENWIELSGHYEESRQAIYRGVDSKVDHRSGFFHIEYFSPYRPAASGQARANSGVYFKHVYEQQITDSFGIDGIASNEGGGLYGHTPPLRNGVLPPLKWFTYDVFFTDAQYDGQKIANAKFTTFLNGIFVHDGSEMPDRGQGGNPEFNGGGPLFLQDHSNPVYFRNIWFIENEEDYPTLDFIFQPEKQCGDPNSPAFVEGAFWPSMDAADCIVSVNDQNNKSFQIKQHNKAGGVSIEISGAKGNVTYTLIDLKGTQINKVFSNKSYTELELGSLSPGMYILQIQSESYNFSKTLPIL